MLIKIQKVKIKEEKKYNKKYPNKCKSCKKNMNNLNQLKNKNLKKLHSIS